MFWIHSANDTTPPSGHLAVAVIPCLKDGRKKKVLGDQWTPSKVAGAAWTSRHLLWIAPWPLQSRNRNPKLLTHPSGRTDAPRDTSQAAGFAAVVWERCPAYKQRHCASTAYSTDSELGESCPRLLGIMEPLEPSGHHIDTPATSRRSVSTYDARWHLPVIK